MFYCNHSWKDMYDIIVMIEYERYHCCWKLYWNDINVVYLFHNVRLNLLNSKAICVRYRNDIYIVFCTSGTSLMSLYKSVKQSVFDTEMISKSFYISGTISMSYANQWNSVSSSFPFHIFIKLISYILRFLQTAISSCWLIRIDFFSSRIVLINYKL